MIPVSHRIAAISESATIKVDTKAKALAAQGRSIISFGTGEPDFATPDHIVEAAVRAARDPKNHHYSASSGLPALREAIAEKTLRDSGLVVSPSQIIVTNGGKQAVYESFATLINDGDEVLLPAPYWTTYPDSIVLAGGRPVDVFASAEQQYKVTVDQLEAARTDRTRGLVFVSPSNPTGAVYTDAETTAIAHWAVENDIWVIADEIYQNLTYGGVTATSIVELVPEMAERTILANGVAKTYAMTGWRVGWLVAPSAVAKAAGNLQSHLCSNVSNVSQYAAIAALTGPQDAAAAMRESFDRRRALILGELRQIPGVDTPTPDGAFYVYPDVRRLLGRTWAGQTPTTSLDLADLLLDKIGVAAVPGEAFGRGGYLRFSYALADEDLLEGMARLKGLFAEEDGTR
jgi:aspartate aminotransferase